MTHRWFLLLLTALFLAACGGGGSPAIQTIEVSPAMASKQVGETQQFSAVAKDASGNVISGVTFTWSSDNTAVATVDSSGLATAVAQGTATITATAGGKSGSATFTVTVPPPPAINTIEVSPATASKQVGETQQFSAVAKDASGNVISGVTFTWSSSDTAVATVDSSGLATAVAQGTATITATAGGKSGSATLTVTPIPTYTVGGEVRYLNGSGLVLTLDSQTKAISANGSFTFDTAVPNGTYSVSVQTQPTGPAQACSVTPSSVTVNGANVSNLLVECSPYTQWLASAETDMGNAITTDAQGNVIVAGLSKDVLGDEVGTLALAFPDVVVAKYAPNGTRLWVKQFTVGDPNVTPNAESQAKGVATDAAGNIYVVGSAYVAASSAFKGFVLKLSPAGAKITSIKLDESSSSENGLTSVAVVGSEVYVGGYTAGTVTNGTNAGGEDAALYKLDANLDPVWAKQFGSTANDRITALAADAGGVYAAGFASGALPGQTHLGDTDAFAAKYDPAGTQQWLQQFGTPFGDGANAVALSGTHVYVAGYVTGNYVTGTYNGGTDLFVTKFPAAGGSEVWRRQYSPTDTGGIQINPYGMAADALGNVYIVGDVNTSVGGNETHAGGQDVFILQYLADGSFGWARQQGSAQDEIALAVTLLGSDLYLTGWSKGALDGYTNSGQEDIFVLKYDTAGNKK